MSRTLFVTGSSTGLGRASALLFAPRGWKVIANMRDPAKETELRAVAGVTLLPLDVTKPAQIAEAARAALALGPVDVVFNNAGYGLAGPFAGASDKQIAQAVYEAATDGKDQLTYVAGADAKATYEQRLAVGIEKFRKAIGQRFLG